MYRQKCARARSARCHLLGPIGALILALAMMSHPGAAHAQGNARADSQPTVSIAVDVDKAQLVRLSNRAKSVIVINPDIADVQLTTPMSFLVVGKKPGTTTVFATTESGGTTSFTVRISRPVSELEEALRHAVPTAQITVAATPVGVTIAGAVNSPREAERLKATARQFLGDKETLNFDVAINAAIQVTLRVRVAEVSRNINKQLGINWSGLLNNGSMAVGLLTGRTAITSFGNFIAANSPNTYGSVGVGFSADAGRLTATALIDALDQDGLASILAEPTLTALSGETASFLAGGEYPVPVPQGNQTVTIDYKRYGISVDFTPTVLDGNRINIKVRPEVSALTSVGSLTLDNVSVPALTVRRADTTVELGSGESFAIAGLFQNNGQNEVQGLPWMQNLPIIGALFRSTSFLRNESELVIIVTPYIVKPVTSPSALLSPTQTLQYSSDLERILSGRTTAVPVTPVSTHDEPAAQPHLRGPAGFMLE